MGQIGILCKVLCPCNAYFVLDLLCGLNFCFRPQIQMKTKTKIPSKVKLKNSDFKMFFCKNFWNSGCLAKMCDCTVKLYLSFFMLFCKFCLFEDT